MTDETARAALGALFAEAQGHLREGRLDQAEAALRRVLRRAPEHPRALYALGLLRHRQGRPGEAAALLERAMPALARDPVACFNVATVLLEQGRPEEAAEALRRAMALRPGYDDAELQLGVACVRSGRPEAAVAAFESVLARSPDNLAALMNLAGVLASHRPGEAVAYAERAVAAAPRDRRVPALNLLAKALAMAGREDEAVAAYDEALKLAPDDLRARFGAAVVLPRVYAEQADIERWRARYARALADFDAWLKLESEAEVAAAAETVFTLGNFPLPQQGRDDRALQEVYGRLLHRIAAARHPGYARPLSTAARPGRLRVGFVSAFFRAHSIAKTHGAWARRLDRERFEVFAVHTGTEADEATEGFRRDCEHFVHHPRADAALLARLKELDLDVLVYPDLGMEPAMLLPAALRLAPVQCQGLGHPETSGLPTMDWALSSALMEPEGGEAHYSERLERLPNTSFCYALERVRSQRDGTDLGHLRRAGVVYLCSQNLGKLLPRHDALFARVLARVPDSELWFVGRAEPAISGRFRRRLEAACAVEGVAPERVVLHPRMGQAAFLALNAAADVLLDGVGWSGCNTTFESLAMGLPVVTWPGGLMRGRHSLAILTQAGLGATVARSADDYVEIAARLGADAAWRAECRAAVAAQAPRAFDDETPIRALEAFLLRATARA